MQKTRVLSKKASNSVAATDPGSGASQTECLVVCARGGRIVHAGDGATELFGADHHQILHMPILELLDVEIDGEPFHEPVDMEALYNRAVEGRCDVFVCAGGHSFHVSDVVTPIFDEDEPDRITSWIWAFEFSPALIEDIFQHAHQFIDSLSEAVFIADENDVILYANERLCDLAGRSNQELINCELTQLFDAPFDGGSELADTGAGSDNFLGRYLNTMIGASGERLWVEVGVSSMDGIIERQGVKLGILANVTGRMRAELAAQKSTEKLRKLVHYLPVAITSFNAEQHCYEFVNEEFQRQSGYSRSEFDDLNADTLIDMVHPDDRERIFGFFRRWESDGFPGRQNIQYRINNKNGETVWLDTYLFAELDEHGKVDTINQICVDITRLRSAQTALEDALRQDFRRTVENLQNLVFKLVRRSDGKYVYRLREGKLAGEINSTVVYDRSPDEIFGVLHRERVGPQIAKAFEGNSVRFEMEFEGQWLFYVLEPVFEQGIVREVVGSAVDITELKKVELRLRDSEARNRRLIDAIPLGIMQIVVTSGGQINYIANRAFESQTGYSVEEFVRLSSDESESLYHPNDSERVNQLWARWFSEDSPSMAHDLYRFRHKSGEYRYMEMYATRFRAEGGDRYFIQAAMDVTEKKLAENRLKMLATFPEENPNPILEISVKGKVTYQNQVAQQHFPDIAERGLEHQLLAWLPPYMDGLVNKAGKTIRHEYENANVVYDLSVSYLPEGEILRIFCHIITEQKQAERQLRKALTTERELNALKTRFVSTVSHEFRTPLAGILSSAEILERYADRLEEWRRKEEIGKIKSRVTELTHLMDDFLLQSSLPAAGERLSYGDVDLSELCRDVTENLQETDPAASAIEYECELDNSVLVGDARLLRQVVKNLLSNAVKYSGAGSPIELRVREQGDFLELRVADKGIGIPASEQVRLFTPFFRASNVLQRPGTGIGLSLVKEFVELHGGTIDVESRVGQGSTFIVLLPRRQPAQNLENSGTREQSND